MPEVSVREFDVSCEVTDIVNGIVRCRPSKLLSYAARLCIYFEKRSETFPSFGDALNASAAIAGLGNVLNRCISSDDTWGSEVLPTFLTMLKPVFSWLKDAHPLHRIPDDPKVQAVVFETVSVFFQLCTEVNADLDNDILRIIADLWIMENEDYHCYRSMAYGLATILTETSPYTLNLHYLGNADDAASCALQHVQRSVSRYCDDASEPVRGRDVVADMDVLTTLCRISTVIRRALYEQGKVAILTDALVRLTEQPSAESTDYAVIRSCCTAIHCALEEGDGIHWVVTSLQNGLLIGMLQALTWPQSSDSSFLVDGVIRVSQIIANYVVYQPVVRALVRYMKKAEAKVRPQGFHRHWIDLKDLVAVRLGVCTDVLYDATPHNHPICSMDPLYLLHPQCRARETQEWKFHRCAGCLRAYYCSQACQRHDWKHGEHRDYCRLATLLRYTPISFPLLETEYSVLWAHVLEIIQFLHGHLTFRSFKARFEMHGTLELDFRKILSPSTGLSRSLKRESDTDEMFPPPGPSTVYVNAIIPHGRLPDLVKMSLTADSNSMDIPLSAAEAALTLELVHIEQSSSVV